MEERAGASLRRFALLRQPEVLERCRAHSVLVQPVGAVEQHGPHLPLATDLIIAEAAAEAAVERFGEALDLWLLPSLAYTKSNEHAGAAGTIWLSAATLLAVLDDLGRSLAATPARRLVFLNGHGGNSALLEVACRDLRLRHGLLTFLLHPSVPPDQGGASPASELGMGIHGGAQETSLLLHLAPSLVDMSRAPRAIPAHLAANQYVRFGGPVKFGWLAADFGPSGVIGDATLATPAAGAELWEGIVGRLGEALAEVSRFTFAAPPA